YVATELDHHPGLGEGRTDRLRQQVRQVVTESREIQRLVLFVVRDAEPAAEVEVAHRGGRRLRQPQQQLHCPPLGIGQDIGVQVLGTREDVEAEELTLGVV